MHIVRRGLELLFRQSLTPGQSLLAMKLLREQGTVKLTLGHTFAGRAHRNLSRNLEATEAAV